MGLNPLMSQRPRKKARRVPEDIQRAEYVVKQTARRGVHVVERAGGQPADSTLNVETTPEVPALDNVAPDVFDPGHDFIPTLDEIRSDWGRVGQ
jgi:hypothetical protein